MYEATPWEGRPGSDERPTTAIVLQFSSTSIIVSRLLIFKLFPSVNRYVDRRPQLCRCTVRRRSRGDCYHLCLADRSAYRMQFLQRADLDIAVSLACSDGLYDCLRAGHSCHARNVVLQSRTPNCLFIEV